MALVFAGICSHAPGITGRADRADPVVRDAFYAELDRMRQAIEDSGAEALVVVAAEHFANFFMNNMPAYAMGMGRLKTLNGLVLLRRKFPAILIWPNV
jgi:2,3-dihydroxyphenylpropionate 1,2-dioxygenase